MIAGFRRLYGASPLHLVAHLLAFLVAAWAIGQILDGGMFINWIAWFVGAALLHDLVLLPLYSSLDRGLGIVAPARPGREAGTRAADQPSAGPGGRSPASC